MMKVVHKAIEERHEGADVGAFSKNGGEEEEYDVEKILDVKLVTVKGSRKKQVEWLIKWLGFAGSDNT